MEQSPQVLKFPKGFLFGTATSSFQVEGDTGDRNSDWDIFLKKHSKIIKPGQVGPQWWMPGKAEADIDLAASLGMQVQRLSLEWARIEPERGKINHDALKRYREILDYLKKNNIKPMVTINHYTLPHWISEKGSWESSIIIEAFEKYTQLVISEFGDVTEWITINEPGILVEAGYLAPFFPPRRFGIIAALRARANMLEAHRCAYKVIKRNNPKALVSMAFAFRWYRPENKKSYLEHKYAYLANHFDNLNYVDAVKDTLDFIGVNFYTGFYLNFNPIKFVKNVLVPHGAPPLLFGEVVKPGAYISDFFGPIVPDFFLNLLRVLQKRYSLPIYITENGVADRRDQYRPFYILTHLVALWKAQQEGVDIRQYLVWSMIDNLEWLQGYRQDFGLIHLDPVTGQRTIRQSAEMYKEIIHSNGIDIKKLLDSYIPEEQKIEARKLIDHMLDS